MKEKISREYLSSRKSKKNTATNKFQKLNTVTEVFFSILIFFSTDQQSLDYLAFQGLVQQYIQNETKTPLRKCEMKIRSNN